MRIVIGNIPDDVTEDGIQDALSAFAPVESIKLVHESGAPTAVLDMDMTKADADALAKRIQGRIYEGRELRAWVPIMNWK